jgi:hypothetical protein
MLLVDKLGYRAVSLNLDSAADDLTELAAEFGKWKAVDLVAAYHHRERGLLVANPKVAAELINFGPLRKRELLVIYAGKGGRAADEICQKAAALAVSLFEGAKPKIPAELYSGSFTVKKIRQVEVPQEGRTAKKAVGTASSGAGSRKKTDGEAPNGLPVMPISGVSALSGPGMTPLYSVVVRNEFFHNGNVEAWKRIIDSYTARYPELQVHIYYEGELIRDISSLFQWGKVKHGSSIQFAVAGSGIRDVAKLQRYLTQGASLQFEAFLHSPVGSVLRLF